MEYVGRVRTLLLSFALVVVGCGGKEPEPSTPKPEPVTTPSAVPEKAPEKDPAPAAKVGPEGFPLPADAGEPESAGGGGGKILVFKVPRGRDAVVADQKALLAKGGYSIDDENTSPKGALRLTVSKGGKTFKVSILGDATQTGIILTLP